MVNLSMVMMIILNHYRKTRKILHRVIQKKLLPPIVYTTTRLWDGSYWENRITLCKAISNLATNSVCQTNKIHKTVIINAKISLTGSGIKAENEPDNLNDIFFLPVKSLIYIKANQSAKSWSYWFCKHGTCDHICPLDREFALPMTLLRWR